MEWRGPDKLRRCAQDIRRRADFKNQKDKRQSTLTWVQADCRDELARLIGASADQKIEDAPPENND